MCNLHIFPETYKDTCVGHNNSVGIATCSGFGGLVVSMLASGTRHRGFKPGQSRRIFSGVKILRMPSFGREVADLRHVKEPC
jgi:hypothetical protein